MPQAVACSDQVFCERYSLAPLSEFHRCEPHVPVRLSAQHTSLLVADQAVPAVLCSTYSLQSTHPNQAAATDAHVPVMRPPHGIAAILMRFYWWYTQ